MEIPVQVGVHEKIVFGIIHIADQQSQIPRVLIMCYGMNGNRVEQHRMSVKLSREASKKNINVMRFDYYNQGISPGTFVKSTIAGKLDDLYHVIKEIKGYFNNKKVEIYLIGFSDGARIAVECAKNCEDVTGVVLWNPIIRTPFVKEVNANPNKEIEKFQIDKETKIVYKQLLGVKMSTKLVSELKNDSTYENLLNRSFPILYIFGSKDRFTVDLQKCIHQIGIFKEDIDFIHIVEGSAHIFANIAYEQEVIDTTIGWIKEGIEC